MKSNNKYYRITYNGEGIYNALKNRIDSNVWQKILLSENINWLPKPPKYSSNNTSYFTEKGYLVFSNKTMPTIYKYLKKENIKIEMFDEISDSILYSDEYQIVVNKES